MSCNTCKHGKKTESTKDKPNLKYCFLHRDIVRIFHTCNNYDRNTTT